MMRILPSAVGGGATERDRISPFVKARCFADECLTNREILTDRVVDGGLQRTQALVVGLRQIEVDTRRTVVVHLNTGHKRAVEALIDQRVDDVQIGVQLAHELAKYRIHRRLDTAREFHGIGQRCQNSAVLYSKPGHGDFATVRADHAVVGELAASTGVKRRCREQDRPWPR